MILELYHDIAGRLWPTFVSGGVSGHAVRWRGIIADEGPGVAGPTLPSLDVGGAVYSKPPEATRIATHKSHRPHERADAQVEPEPPGRLAFCGPPPMAKFYAAVRSAMESGVPAIGGTLGNLLKRQINARTGGRGGATRRRCDGGGTDSSGGCACGSGSRGGCGGCVRSRGGGRGSSSGVSSGVSVISGGSNSSSHAEARCTKPAHVSESMECTQEPLLNSLSHY
mmetsp:Transcript_95083/g.212540  ORF Transcript_95083/g.212540 Transcript_95083/m.212540 type:complete len:225 (-) Transcript_95083:6-680(-)